MRGSVLAERTGKGFLKEVGCELCPLRLCQAGTSSDAVLQGKDMEDARFSGTMSKQRINKVSCRCG